MNKIALSFLLALMILPSTLIAQNYSIDSSHSSVLMKVQRFGVVNVIGRFGDIDGNIQYNSDDIALTTVNINAKTDSYTANNPGGETSAMGPAFLDAENFPMLSFTLTDISQVDDNLNVTGDLTIHGITKTIDFEAKVIGPLLDLPTRKQSVALSGMIAINRLDFGVGPDRTLPDGREIIGNRVEIIIEILAIAE